MTPEVAKIIVETFLTELAIAKGKYQEAQKEFQMAQDSLEATTIRLASIMNIKESLLQFPDIMDAFSTMKISLEKVANA